jgi:Putative peptidoglycan binding domain
LLQRSPSSLLSLACLAALALGAQTADAATHHRPTGPVLLSAHCTRSCAGTRTVTVGGTLRLRGHHIARGLTVVFPSASGKNPAASAPLRMTTVGLVVTVPSRAGTGLVHVKDGLGHRSNAVGPVVVRRLALAPRPVPVSTAPGGPSPFDGNGMWIWELPKSSGGSLTTIIAQAAAHDISTVFVKSSDGPNNFWSQFTPSLIATLHAAGLQVCAWQYVYGSSPAGEAALGVRAVKDGADCLVIDAEVEYEGRYSAAQTYVTDLRAGVGDEYPIALAGFPYVDYHPAFPYSVFLGPGGAQYNAPQMYWKDIGVSVDTVFAHTYTNNTIYGRPIFPLGQTFQSPSSSDIVRFRQLAAAYGATGVSWWDWQETPSAQFTAVGQTLPALTGFTPTTAMPLLKAGGKSDQIVWLQEHLATGDPGLKVDGVFGKTTTTALKALQTAQDLPATGTTDAATWKALLAVIPTMANWNGSGTAARAARAPRSAGAPDVSGG